ncbi:MAG: hypothetical protein OHK0015_25350 [Chloroflexi bacterium OHK40]
MPGRACIDAARRVYEVPISESWVQRRQFIRVVRPGLGAWASCPPGGSIALPCVRSAHRMHNLDRLAIVVGHGDGAEWPSGRPTRGALKPPSDAMSVVSN